MIMMMVVVGTQPAAVEVAAAVVRAEGEHQWAVNDGMGCDRRSDSIDSRCRAQETGVTCVIVYEEMR